MNILERSRYAILCGWQGLFSAAGSSPGAIPHCLADVALIPPCDRILLEMTFSELSRWAVGTLRSCLVDADMYFKSLGISPGAAGSQNNKESVSLGVLPVSRFLLAALGILSAEHQANSASLLMNSGLLALTQTALRIIGEIVFLLII